MAEWQVYSRDGDEAEPWTLHAEGPVCLRETGRSGRRDSISTEVKSEAWTAMDAPAFYQLLDAGET